MTVDGTISTEMFQCIFYINAFPQHGLSENKLVEKKPKNTSQIKNFINKQFLKKTSCTKSQIKTTFVYDLYTVHLVVIISNDRHRLERQRVMIAVSWLAGGLDGSGR